MHRSVVAIALLVGTMVVPWNGSTARAGTLKGTVIYPAVHEDIDPRPEARKPLGAWRLENGRLRIAAEADVLRDVVLVLEPTQPVAVDPQPMTIEARKDGVLTPRLTVALLGTQVTWKNADVGPRVVTLEDGDTLLPPEPTPPGGTREVRFTRDGEYVFLDPEHPFARATVVVVITPFVARADDRGAFSFEAPDGRYHLKAWWRGRWIDILSVELGPNKGHEPVVVKLPVAGANRAEVKADPAAPTPQSPSVAPAATPRPAPVAPEKKR